MSPSPISRAPEAEIRHATVLKCDIVESTHLKRGLDLDGQLTFKRRLEEVITEVASRHAGYIKQFEGDGAIVFFGYPDAREDAPESGLGMALDLVEAIRTSTLVPGETLRVRVGVASGILAITREAPVARGEPYTGLIIDMAERLRVAAGVNEVLVCETTKRLAARFFEYEERGVVAAKGFDEGLRAWRVVRRSSLASRFDAQRYDQSRSEIIGRRDVLACLSEAWTEARAGKGRIFCLIGEAGIGKSRLARAALDTAVSDHGTVLTLDCMPSTGNTPLFPIGVLLCRRAGIPIGAAQGDVHDRVTAFLSQSIPPAEVPGAIRYLAPLFGLASEPDDQAPDQVRDHTVSLTVALLRGLMAAAPSVFLCEDLHWADASTTTIIERLAAEIAGLPVLMIVTARPDIGHVPSLPGAITVTLPPLDAASSTALVRSVARGAALSDAVVRRIVDRCEGVPLLLEEVTRSTLETPTAGDSMTVASEAVTTVPTPLQFVVESRLGRLPDLERIVQAASVLGRDFSIAVLREMVPEDRRAKVDDAVALCIEHRLFGHASPGRAQFSHAMICEAVHETLMPRARTRLHSHAADILASGYAGTPDAAPDVLAEHLRVAERWEECIDTHLAASANTAARGAYVEAEGHCDAALRLIAKVPSDEQRRELRFKLELQRCVALTGRHGYAHANVEHAYRTAESVCGEGAEAEKLYPIMRGLATFKLVRGELSAAHQLSQQGLALAELSNRPAFLIDAMEVQCYTTLYYGSLADCRSWIERCLALYRENNGIALTYPSPQDAATAAWALLPTVAWLLGDAHGAEDAIKRGKAHVRKLKSRFDRALLHAWIAGTRYTQRRYDEAEKEAKRAIKFSDNPRYEDWYNIGHLMKCLAQAAQRAEPECLERAGMKCAEFAAKNTLLNASYYLWGLARGYATMGDPDTAVGMLRMASQMAEQSQDKRMNAELLILEAELQPDDALARSLLAQALQVADAEGAITTSLRAAVGLIVRSGRRDAEHETARKILDVLDGRKRCPTRWWMHGQLARLRPRLDQVLAN